LVRGAENDTVIVCLAESTVRAGFPQETDARQALPYILLSVGATKLVRLAVVGFAGFSAKAAGGEPLVMPCQWTVASAALDWLPHKAAAQTRQTGAVALLLAFITFLSLLRKRMTNHQDCKRL
jgi:hypothetical protein